MTIQKIIDITSADVAIGAEMTDKVEMQRGFACDLMSDVLTIETDGVLLITGLCNTQTIRTAEMSDLKAILFVRGKHATDEMLTLAEQNGIILLETPMSMFRTVATLAKEGLEPLF